MKPIQATRNPPSWLTVRRVRVHAILLALGLWSVYAFNVAAPGMLDRNGLIKGTDFLHFYTLGTLVLRHRGDLLYDMQAQLRMVQQMVPTAGDHLYVALYGPQVALLFAPFARLSYSAALLAWLTLNVGLYALCCYLVWRGCEHLKGEPWTVAVLALSFPGFFHLLAWGQTSGLALLCLTLGYLALRREQRVLAGVAIGALIFKPQLGLAAACIFVLTGEWKLVMGAALSATVELAIGWLYFGSATMGNYWRAITHIPQIMPWLEPRPYQMHSLRAFWNLLLPWPRTSLILYILTSVVAIAAATCCWKSKARFSIRYASLLLTSVLVAPHLTVYDLVILAPAFLLLGDWIMSDSESRWKRPTGRLLYACYPLFLLGPLAQVTHLQFSVLAMAGLLLICLRVSRRFPQQPAPATLMTP